jgi:tRNA 2-thiouridine synthesizing protein A
LLLAVVKNVMSSSSNEAQTAESLIRDLERLSGVPCAGCRMTLSHHQVVMAIAMGFKNAPRCLKCLGAALERDPAQLRDSLFEYVRQRECYSGAWDWANRAAGLPEGSMPSALQSLTASDTGADPINADADIVPTRLPTDAEWDAGELGCGELVLELRLRLETLPPGKLFHLVARDPGAPEDLPAWCRLIGHTLVRAEPPNYWIQRKD